MSDRRGRKAHKVSKVKPEQLGQRELMEQSVQRAIEVMLVRLDHRARKDLRVIPASKVWWDQKEIREMSELQDLKAHKV
jgi:hypothetical protein